MPHPPSPLRAVPLAMALLLSACAGAGPGAEFAERDPYEDVNRNIHDFNIALDRNVLRPVSQGYGTVTPTLIQHLLGNAFDQIDTLNDFLNYTLQGELEPAGTALGRLTVNTVLGAGGLLDPATEFGLPKENTDFGVTLGKWGAEEGAYLVLPFFGPSTTRDLGGRLGNAAMSPFTYVGFFDSNVLNFFNPALSGSEVVHDRHVNASTIDEVLYESPDSYVALRAIYLQRRDRLIGGKETEVDRLPDIFDDEPAQ
jgi:phospholipid-binding lipoprotein MlaA